ncbi:MAG: hypothetical protein SFU56_00690 [Capsulimonadales bacterium]|nr:hypothetical protein [Capsulimonadales bacterium]
MSKTPNLHRVRPAATLPKPQSLLMEKGEIEGVTAIHPAPEIADGRPHPDWVRGRCPECGDDLVSSMYHVRGRGYLLCWECWGARGESGACTYRRVL